MTENMSTTELYEIIGTLNEHARELFFTTSDKIFYGIIKSLDTETFNTITSWGSSKITNNEFFKVFKEFTEKYEKEIEYALSINKL